MSPWFITEDIVIVEGVDWTWTNLYDPNNVPVDLSSGWSSAFKIRVNFSDTSAVLTLATGGQGVVLAADSSVATSIAAAQATTLVTAVPGLQAFYAQTLTNAATGKVVPFKSGGVTIQRNAAR